MTQPARRKSQRAVLVGLVTRAAPRRYEHPLAELRRLASTAGTEVVGEVVQKRIAGNFHWLGVRWDRLRRTLNLEPDHFDHVKIVE